MPSRYWTPVTVYNSASYTAVFVDDSADTIGRNVTYSKTGIGGVAPGHIGWSSNDVGSVRLYLGSGSDAVHVASSTRNVNGRSFINQIDLGGGNNECYVTGSGLGLASVNNFYGNVYDDQFVISAVPTDVASVKRLSTAARKRRGMNLSTPADRPPAHFPATAP